MAFRILGPESSQSNQASMPNQEISGKFRLLPPEPETNIEAGTRHVARSASRIGETLAGLPGDILQAPGKFAKYALEKATGEPNEEYETAFKIAESFLPGTKLPTSSELRKKTNELSEGRLEPKTEGEKLSDSIVSDFASLAFPLKGKIPFIKSLGIALGSNLAEKGAKEFGFGETTQAWVKNGSMFLLSLMKPGGAKKYGDQLFGDAKKLVPKGASISSQNLSKEVSHLKEQLKKGGSAPYKTASLTKLGEIESKIAKGKIPVDELTQFKIDINNARSSLYGDVALDKAGRAMAKRNLDSTAKIVDNALTEYGHTNPEWAKKYRSANEVFGSIAQSKQVSNSIGRLIKSNPHTSGAILAAKLFLAPSTLPIAIGGFGALKAGELVTRIVKSKTLQGYYKSVVESALRDDAAAMSKNLNKLDSGLKKQNSKENPTEEQ